MNLKVGIVGLPNAGKSTLFNALLKRQAAFAANYPFATIEPNIGVVPVPDERLKRLADIVALESTPGVKNSPTPGLLRRPPMVPTTVEFVDIAGLVKGASEGQGLGNKFLSHIREVNVIAHVIRHFPDPDVVHVSGEVDPQRDREVIETELILADLQTLEKIKSSPSASLRARKLKVQNYNEKFKVSAVEKLISLLNKGILAKDVALTSEEREVARELHLLTMKPVLYVANVSEAQLVQGQSFGKGLSLSPDAIVISAKIEAELADLPEDEQREYLTSLGLAESGLERLIQKAYEMLGLISFLTMGEKEVRAWTIGRGMTAQQASGEIHTDFMQKFIKAEVIAFEELDRIGSRTKARELGKIRLEGREYAMQDGDVVEFKIGV